MLRSIVEDEKDLIVEEFRDRARFVKHVESKHPYRFCSFDLNVIAEVFEKHPNLILLNVSFEMFHSCLKETPYVNHEIFTVRFDTVNEQIIMSDINTSTDYFVSEIGFDGSGMQYIFVLFPYNGVKLYGSALTYFRNKTINRILRDL